MIRWLHKRRLLAILSSTKDLLLESKKDGWPDISPAETILEIDELIAYISNPDENILPKYARLLYVVTGPLQEIAISNGWHDSYLSLAKKYDKLEYVIKRK
jgi:hypothetical protein